MTNISIKYSINFATERENEDKLWILAGFFCGVAGRTTQQANIKKNVHNGEKIIVLPPVPSMRGPGQGEAVGLVSVVVPLGGDDDVLAVVGGHHLLGQVGAGQAPAGLAQVLKALVRPALSVAEAELVVGQPGVGVGEGVHAAAGAGAVHEGTLQQVNWSHLQHS